MTFVSVPFVLLRVCAPWEAPAHAQCEYTHPELGDVYGRQPLDPWKRGDLVVSPRHNSVFKYGEGTKQSTTFEVAQRHTSPSVRTAKFRFGDGHVCYTPRPYYRIVKRFLGTAHKLIGQSFPNLEALASALTTGESNA